MQAIKKTRTSDIISNIVAIIFALFLFYYSYRYILRYNSEDTSPTYNPTPISFQITKYLLLAMLCFGLLYFFLINNVKLNPKPTVLFLLLFLFQLQNIYAFIVCKSISNIISFLCLFPALLLILGNHNLSLFPIDGVFRFFLNFTIVYEIIQILLYLTIGRLPALAYDTGAFTDVRFGGAWDDPNGFSILLSFFIPYVFYSFRGAKRIVYLSILFLFLLLTWSMTGIFSTIGIFLILGIIKFLRAQKRITRKKILVFVIALAVIIAVCLCLLFVCYDAIIYFIYSKMGSIQGHLSSWNLQNIPIEAILGIVPIDYTPESSIIALIAHGGIVHMIIFYMMGGVSIQYAYRTLKKFKKNNKYYAFQMGIFIYQLVFLVASINLPFVYSFSNFGIFALFIALSSKNANQLNQSQLKESLEGVRFG